MKQITLTILWWLLNVSLWIDSKLTNTEDMKLFSYKIQYKKACIYSSVIARSEEQAKELVQSNENCSLDQITILGCPNN